MWIATLCLLAIAAWLFFNALNERRWVETHKHDETVASDEGLFASLTALTGTAGAAARGEETVIGRTYARVTDRDGVLRKTADRVAGGIGNLEKKVETRLSANRAKKSADSTQTPGN